MHKHSPKLNRRGGKGGASSQLVSSRKQLGILSLNWIWRSDRPVHCLGRHEAFTQRPLACRLLAIPVSLLGLTGRVASSRLTTCFLTRDPEQPFTALGARRQTPDDSVYKASIFPQGQGIFPEQLGEAPDSRFWRLSQHVAPAAPFFPRGTPTGSSGAQSDPP